MESGGSGIATTQSHHQGRASKHEHGDASHVQQHSAHAAGGREGGALSVLDGDCTKTSVDVASAISLIDLDGKVGQSCVSSSIPSLVVRSSCLQRNGEAIGREVVACRSLGFHKSVRTIVETGNLEVAFCIRRQNRTIILSSCPASDLSIRNGGPLVIGILQLELGVLQLRFVILGINLGDVETVGEDDDLVFRGCCRWADSRPGRTDQACWSK